MLIDCFTFNKEFDLLEGRLEYLSGLVDYFVIVEADITFSGIPREFSLVRNLARYRRFQHKILYFPCSIDTTGLDFSRPVETYDRTAPAWFVESTQRNHFLAALALFRDADKVIISDVDEIPSKAGLKLALDSLSDEMPMIACRQQMFYYNFDHVQKTPWSGPVLTSVAKVKALTPEGVRMQRGSLPQVLGGGWHLSNWMSPEEIVDKIRSFAHQEYNTEEYADADRIKEHLRQGRDFLGRVSNEMIPFDKNTLPDDFKSVFAKYTPDSL